VSAGHDPEGQAHDSAVLACFDALWTAIHARDAFLCPETALARDAAARALLRVCGVDPEFGPLRVLQGGRR
jgi:hypothetical protein